MTLGSKVVMHSPHKGAIGGPNPPPATRLSLASGSRAE